MPNLDCLSFVFCQWQAIREERHRCLRKPSFICPCLLFVLLSPDLLDWSSWYEGLKFHFTDIVDVVLSDKVKQVILARYKYILSDGPDSIWKDPRVDIGEEEAMESSLQSLAEVIKSIKMDNKPKVDDELGDDWKEIFAAIDELKKWMVYIKVLKDWEDMQSFNDPQVKKARFYKYMEEQECEFKISFMLKRQARQEKQQEDESGSEDSEDDHMDEGERP